MYISNFRVSNYKSYRNSAEIELKRGFNVITGQNSAGKTALLEALTLAFTSAPHRSEKTMPFSSSRPSPTSSASITLIVSGRELVQHMAPGVTYMFPRPIPNSRESKTGRLLKGTEDEMNEFLRTLHEGLELEVKLRVDRIGGNELWRVEGSEFCGVYQTEVTADGRTTAYQVVLGESGIPHVVAGPVNTQPFENALATLAPSLRSRIYRFHAERFNPGQYDVGIGSVLLPDAANLPQVLNVLMSNRVRFDRYNAVVDQILPQVRQVSVRPLFGNKVEVLIWPTSYASERIDLAIPLNECGSGVGQVLAILYVVMTSEYPQTIIIDEIQSFLHPGAVRKLIQVLKNYPGHQYILATHSPTVISAAEPATLYMLRNSDAETCVETIDPNNEKELETYLGEIGARLSDVFGADNILWVEGQTEEICFPLLLRHLAGRPLMGTAILGVRHTGDFQTQDRKDRKRVLETYRRLSEAKTLVPKSIAFVFDQECLVAKEQQELRQVVRGLVYFLPRRMYENYLLEPEGIAEVLNGLDRRMPPVSADEVNQLFDEKRGERDPRDQTKRQLLYFCKGTTDVPDDWTAKIHAADLLRDIFRELSENRVEYEKTTHSVALTKWLIPRRSETLGVLAKWLAGVIWPSNAKPT
jgi:energy-coupling factor transporter ATP-binding protein EcfA2